MFTSYRKKQNCVSVPYVIKLLTSQNVLHPSFSQSGEDDDGESDFDSFSVSDGSNSRSSRSKSKKSKSSKKKKRGELLRGNIH